MRFLFLILIIAYGVFVAWHTLSAVTYSSIPGHASASFNTLAFYLICVFFYLVINKVKSKELVFLLIYTFIVTGFVMRLIYTLNQ